MAKRRNKKEIPNNFYAALIQVPDHHVEPDFLAQCGGALYESVFFDDSVNTYAASTVPSVGIEVLGLVAEEYPDRILLDDDESEALHDELMEAHSVSEDFYYMNRSDLERLKKKNPGNFKDLGEFEVDEDAGEDAYEVVREYLQGNPVF